MGRGYSLSRSAYAWQVKMAFVLPKLTSSCFNKTKYKEQKSVQNHKFREHCREHYFKSSLETLGPRFGYQSGPGLIWVNGTGSENVAHVTYQHL